MTDRGTSAVGHIQPIQLDLLAGSLPLRPESRLEPGLAIGDSVRTDLKGASDFGIDCLFVTAGIHAEELGDRHDPNRDALSRIFADAGIVPKAVTRRLVW